jgi:hypothetical protein
MQFYMLTENGFLSTWSCYSGIENISKADVFSTWFDGSKLVVNGNFDESNNSNIALYDIMGRRLPLIEQSSSSTLKVFETTNLAGGIYLVNLSQKANSATQKIVFIK